ncbi:MAG: MFS transporter, partial [Opitutus sp.]
ALVLGLVVLRYLDNGISSARWLTPAEKSLLEKAIVANQAGKKVPPSIAAAFADPRVWMWCLLYFCFIAGQYGLTFWMPTLISATGIKGNFNIGLLSAIPFVVAIISMVLIAQSADRHRERRWHLVIPATVGAIGLIGAAVFSQNAPTAIALLSLAAAGIIPCTPLFWSLPTSILEGRVAAATIAAINSVGNLAGFASPFLVGYLKDATHNNRMGMYTLAGMMILGAALVLKSPRALVNR